MDLHVVSLMDFTETFKTKNMFFASFIQFSNNVFYNQIILVPMR